jgi:HK97 family phage major capsid protein
MGIEPKSEDLKKAVDLAAALEKAADEVRQSGEKLQSEMKNLGKETAETKAAVDSALLKYGELATQHKEVVGRITEIEQTLAKRRQDTEPQQPKSMGQQFIESDQFKSFGGKGTVRVKMPRADITNVTGTVGSNTSTANSLVSTMRVPGIVTPPEQKLTIRDLIAPGTTSQGSVEFVQETGYTNAAALVTEGGTKPQSELTFELKHAPVRTIAHIFKASRQILDDAPALQSYIDARARYGLRLTEEDEILNGDGTGIHLLGLIPSASAFNAQFVVEAKQRMDTIRLAILQVFLSNFPANGVVLHPTDWAAIQLTKDSQERYIIGNPQDGNAARLWNLPVVESLSMDADDFLVGAFNLGAQVFDRMEIEVLLSTEDGDNFKTNMVTLRAEERVALAVYRPEAFVTGAFATAT